MVPVHAWHIAGRHTPPACVFALVLVLLFSITPLPLSIATGKIHLSDSSAIRWHYALGIILFFSFDCISGQPQLYCCIVLVPTSHIVLPLADNSSYIQSCLMHLLFWDISPFGTSVCAIDQRGLYPVDQKGDFQVESLPHWVFTPVVGSLWFYKVITMWCWGTTPFVGLLLSLPPY